MLIYVPLESIVDNPFQRRQDYGNVAALAADIAAHGLLQIPRGRIVYSDGQAITGLVPSRLYDVAAERLNGPDPQPELRVELAFGHRRLRAYRELHSDHPDDNDAGGLSPWATMPVYVESLDDDTMLNHVWSENQHRSDINPIEQAELLAEKLARVRATGGSQTTLATEWGLDRSTIANKLRLLDLPPTVQTAVRDRRLSERQATALLPVTELAQRVNGRDIPWSKDKKPEPYGPPIAPAAFTAYAVAKPEAVTSDTIRDYTRRALNQAGRPLPDDIAKFDTAPVGPARDEETPIVQPLCAGCPYRLNQHCLQPACLDAKRFLFQQTIPTRAAALTGLPWSSDPTHIPRDRDEALALSTAYAAGHRDGLVIAWVTRGWHECWLEGPPGQWRSEDDINNDWRKGLVLGRIPATAAETIQAIRPPREQWRAILSDHRQQRQARVKTAFADAIVPLAQQPAPLRALAYLLFRNYAADAAKLPADPAELAALLADHASRYLYINDEPGLRRALQVAGLDPTTIDPTDPADRLRERAADALEAWHNHTQPGPLAKAAVQLRAVAKLFTAAAIAPDDDTQPADLRDLAHWLALALADIEALDTAAEHPTQEPS